MICSPLAITGVQGLTPYFPGKPVSELQRELGLSNIVKLASNENPLGPSPLALSAIQNACSEELSRYPDGGGFALKQILAKKLAINPDQLTLGNGSNDILEIIARVFLSPQTEAIMSEHAFAVYPLVTQAIGANCKTAVALDYGHDLQAMHDLISDNTRVIFIANPNNPTGTYLQQVAIEQFLDTLPNHIIVVLDQAYFEYSQHTEPAIVDYLQKYPQLIITRTFSKAYGLAGLRVGYSISTPEIAELLNRVRQPFNVNSLALVAAEAALQDDVHLHTSIILNQSGMQQLSAAFTLMQLNWIPSTGNFICVDCGRDATPVYESLLREGVIVRPVTNYGLPQHLRITIGTEAENQLLIHALEKVLA